MDNQVLIEECKQSIDLVFSAFDVALLGAVLVGFVLGFLVQKILYIKREHNHYYCDSCGYSICAEDDRK